MADIKYEIKETVATLSTSPAGWRKELNLISWNGAEPKYDIREWAPEHEKMGKGITLSEEEMKKLLEVLRFQRRLMLLSRLEQRQQQVLFLLKITELL